MEETRVGYAAVNVLQEFVRDYIVTHTAENRYTGELRYISLYNQFERYLRDVPEETESELS